MSTSQSDNLDYMELLAQMEKGFILMKILYDDGGNICNFRIVSANKGMENFMPVPLDELTGSLVMDFPQKHYDPILPVFFKVAETGQALENEYYSNLYKRYVKSFIFSPMPGFVACYLEYHSDSQSHGNRILDNVRKIIQISNNAQEVFWIRSGDKILYVNSAFEKLFGIPCERFYEDIKVLLEVVDIKDYDRVFNMLRNDGNHLETLYNIEFRVTRPDGTFKWLWLKTFVIKENDEGLNKKAATVIDITERKMMEEQLSFKNREITILYDLFKSAADHVTPQGILKKAQQILVEYLGGHSFCVYLIDDEKGRLSLYASHGICQEFLSLAEFLEPFFGLYNENTILPVSTLPDSQIKEVLIKEGIASIGCFPIVYAGKVLGVLNLGLRCDMSISLVQKEFITTICNQLAVLIYNMRLFYELKQELEMRRNAEKENELIFNTSLDLLAILDYDMKFVRISPQWGKCLGWSEQELLGHQLMEFVHPDDKENDLDAIDILTSEGVIMGYENRLFQKDGTIRWFAWNAQVVEENKEKLVIMAGRDITNNKEIEEKNRDLERAYQLESIKMEFFANISHEFRTPLNIILSALQLINHSMTESIKLSPIHERPFRHLRSIKQNAFRLLRLVNNLIDITKLDSGYLKLYPTNSDIVNVVENITQSVAQYIEGKGINLIFDTDVEEKILACDTDIIERIMLNLLSNAVKFTDKGGSIKVIIKDVGDNVRISVIDTGVGIAEDKLDMIFERFVQGERPLSRRCEGSGIGLALVKSLVELHKGRIYANSTINEGSAFTFELPVVMLDQSAQFQGVEPSNEERIHKINVEFSDIYSLN